MSNSTPTANTAPPAKKKKNLAIHLFSGGFAGFCEAVVCHPLDTIKVRLQLRGELTRKASATITQQAAQQVKVYTFIKIGLL